jgi:FKBP-type peptidyl-prolyl cis-trans isomerase FkpA
MKLKILYCILALPLLFMSCNRSEEEKKPPVNINKEALKKQFIEANKMLAQKESDDFDAYARNHHMNFITTPMGLRYYVYSASPKGDSIRDKMEVTMEYTVSLFDGTECYSSKETGPKTFVVGMEEMESGIHKAVKFLKKGDKAIILIPSHMAHGLLGDMNKIPPQMPIIYDIHILDK